jgi:glycosyltransferase involved in cell wall biosynthesis
MRYALPDNVVHLEVHYLHDDRADRSGDQPSGGCPRLSGSALHARAVPEADRAQGGCPSMIGQVSWRTGRGRLPGRRLSLQPRILEFHHRTIPRPLHRPLLRRLLLDGAHHARAAVAADATSPELHPGRAYHTISTGYAGFLGAMLKRGPAAPLLLSEHGIYTKERKIDLFQAEWIRDNRGVFEKDTSESPTSATSCGRFFEALGRDVLRRADRIVACTRPTACARSGRRAAERTENIPNGINLPRCSRCARGAGRVPAGVCLIGRVVPIKDVKTFIRAMRTVVNRLPDAEGWIAGPRTRTRPTPASAARWRPAWG